MVDDELDITVTLKMALEESGFLKVEAFYDPVLTLSRFKARAYDLALLDIHAENIVHCILRLSIGGKRILRLPFTKLIL